MTVVLGAYRSIKAIWSHSKGTTKFPAVMTMEGRYSKNKPRLPSCPLLLCLGETNCHSKLEHEDYGVVTPPHVAAHLAEDSGQEDAIEGCCNEAEGDKSHENTQ